MYKNNINWMFQQMDNFHYFRLSLFWLMIEFTFSGIFIGTFYYGEMLLHFLLPNLYTI